MGGTNHNYRVPARPTAAAATGVSRSQVIVLAGPSGAGKSRLAERIGLPVLRLDDFYKSGGDPTLPLITEGANAGIVDWDDPTSWLMDDAMAALDELCRTGRAEVPIYEIARNGRCGWQTLDLGGSPVFLAEGIFAQEVVPHAREAGMLEAAYCVRQHPMVTFWRRLTRDLREHRKPPLVLVRRGLALLRDQRRVVAHAVALGCEPVTPDEAYAKITS
jgi:uridine kinase